MGFIPPSPNLLQTLAQLAGGHFHQPLHPGLGPIQAIINALTHNHIGHPPVDYYQGDDPRRGSFIHPHDYAHAVRVFQDVQGDDPMRGSHIRPPIVPPMVPPGDGWTAVPTLR